MSTVTKPTMVGSALLRRRPSADAKWFNRVIVLLALLLLVVAVFGDRLAPLDPYRVMPHDALLPPSSEHWFGTDQQGRDVFSRLLVGARSTLLSSVLIVAAGALIGVAIAALAASLPKWLDQLIMRICDIALALPNMVLALGIAMALGPSLRSALIALVISLCPSYIRMSRVVMRETMTASYFEAARLMGASRWRIVTRHLLPNSTDLLGVQAAFDVGGMALMLGGLSFIGVGAQPPSAEWGAMAADGRSEVITAWWMAFFPGVAITLSVITFGLLGELLQTWRDPNLRETS
ncbi:ABC transporter permease [Streptomyces sp. NPDC004721]